MVRVARASRSVFFSRQHSSFSQPLAGILFEMLLAFNLWERLHHSSTSITSSIFFPKLTNKLDLVGVQHWKADQCVSGRLVLAKLPHLVVKMVK